MKRANLVLVNVHPTSGKRRTLLGHAVKPAFSLELEERHIETFEQRLAIFIDLLKSFQMYNGSIRDLADDINCIVDELKSDDVSILWENGWSAVYTQGITCIQFMLVEYKDSDVAQVKGHIESTSIPNNLFYK